MHIKNHKDTSTVGHMKAYENSPSSYYVRESRSPFSYEKTDTCPMNNNDNNMNTSTPSISNNEKQPVNCNQSHIHNNINSISSRIHQENSNINNNKMCPPTEMLTMPEIPTMPEMPIPIFVSSLPFLSGEANDDGDDDGDNTVSSLDSCEDPTHTLDREQAPPLQRSIFGNYWKNTIYEEAASVLEGGGDKEDTKTDYTNSTSPQTLQTDYSVTMSRCSREAAMPLPDEFTYQEFNRDFDLTRKNSATDEYEEILKNNEIGRTTLPRAASLKDVTTSSTVADFEQSIQQIEELMTNSSNSNNNNDANNNDSSPSLRSLFRNKYPSSSPSLCYGYRDIHSHTAVRKTASASSLTGARKKQRSCLRPRGMSLDSTAIVSLQSSTSRLSVSFDAKVFVHEYEKPHERYTNNGWSKFFA